MGNSAGIYFIPFKFGARMYDLKYKNVMFLFNCSIFIFFIDNQYIRLVVYEHC